MGAHKSNNLKDLLANLSKEHECGSNDLEIRFSYSVGPNGPRDNDDQRSGRRAGKVVTIKYSQDEVIPDVGFALCPPDCDHSGLKDCKLDASLQHDVDTPFHETLSSQSKSISIRSLGENYMTIEGDFVRVRSIGKIDGKSPSEGIVNLCLKCQAIDLPRLLNGDEQVHHSTFDDLSATSQYCGLCQLISCSIVEHEPFVPDDNYCIRLAAVKSNSGALRYLQFRLPSAQDKVAQSVTKGGCVVRCVNLEVVSPSHSLGDQEGTALGRLVGPIKDLSRATSWLETCRTSHAKCGTQGAAEPAMPALPSRVLDVSRREVLEDIVLFEAHSSRGQYVALSHRWGDAKISKTMTSTVQEYTARLPISSLSKTFQDAIYVTRELGYRYLWIDSLCIIQDSPDDWEAESSRMAEVYSNASLIISASVASSGDSGLFYPKPAQSLVEIPGSGNLGTCFVTNRQLSSFTEDVERGSLARRAWCLQERVLARRILHFGKDQLHWECLSGCWSEASIDELVECSGTIATSIEAELRQILVSSSWPSLKETLKDLEVTCAEEFGPKQIYSRGPYGKWYRLLNAYSNRQLTVEGDRLPALGGLASVFENFSQDQYVAGLWLDDIPAGLLWSGTELYRPVDSPSLLRRPAKRQAPSWSWTSFEGQIFYPLGKLGDIDILRDWQCLFVAGPPGRFGQVERGFIELSGRLRKLRTMIGFGPGFNASHLSRYYLPDQMPRAVYDEPGKYEVADVECLLIAMRGCGSKTCQHLAGCEFGFAYGLLLLRDAEFGSFRRVGIAQTYQSDWVGVGRTRILIS